MRFGERILETTATTGTSTYTLAGAEAGHVTFGAGLGVGALTGYVVTDGTNFEVGYGTVGSGPATLSRDGIFASSNGGAKVNWGAGTKYVYSAPIGAVLQSLLRVHRGSTRPVWISSGLWVSDADSDVWVLNYYDGSDDIALVRIDRTNDRALVEGAAAGDVASAGTLDLGAATGDYLHITGTTQIEALGTAGAGVRRWLVFDGALVLQHTPADDFSGPALILPTGGNITTAAGDAALFVSEGSGDWRCVTYVRASGEPLVAPGAATTDTAGLVELAIEAEVKAGTSGKVPDAAALNAHWGFAKALATFQVNGTLDAGRNVSSVTKNGTGDFTINFTTPFAHTNYIPWGLVHTGSENDLRGIIVRNRNESWCRINVVNEGSPQDGGVSWILFGVFDPV